MSAGTCLQSQNLGDAGGRTRIFKLHGNLEAAKNNKTLEECVRVERLQMPAFVKE